MILRWALLSLVAFVASAQPPALIPVIGTIENIAGNRIEIRAGERSFTIYADNTTEVVKDRTYRDLSVLGGGNEISARCTEDSSGKLVARRILAGILTFRGVIQSVGHGSFQMDRGGTVRFYPETTFSTSAKDLAVGQEVLVVGVDVRDGSVDALRVTIYNTGHGLDVSVRPR